MVEWLKTLVYGAESRRKVVRWHPGLAIQRQENSLCQSTEACTQKQITSQTDYNLVRLPSKTYGFEDKLSVSQCD